ncbi:MAG TPA: hypothetical protein PLT55_04515 [Acidimicrobiia bacterium]|nr:hypothetical protein [Acidimicrobiia bacterium]
MEDKVCLNSDNLSESRILSMIEDYVCNRFMFEQHNFKMTMRFDEDFGLDRFAFNEMLDFLEEEFTSMSLGFRLDMIERNDIETVLDLLESIRNQIVPNEKAFEDD